MAEFRYPLKNGDRTSTGGILIATGKSFIHHDTTVGVEGDYATCPACKSGGQVRNDCYPAFGIKGKQVLVSGARVYCECPTHPIVLPSQENFRIEVNRRGEGISSSPLQPTTSAVTGYEEDVGNSYDEQVRVVDSKTQVPLVGLPYYIVASDGAAYHGYTDDDGRCKRVSTAQAETLTVYLGEDAEMRMEGRA